MRLTHHLRSDLILPDLDASGLAPVVRALADHLDEHVAGVSRSALEEALLEREKAHTTAMGEGVAVPHATVPGLEEPILFVARARDPVPFGPPESEPVWIFFVLLSPPGRAREHIKLLARICRLVRHPGFLDDLRNAESSDEILGVIEAVDAQHV